MRKAVAVAALATVATMAAACGSSSSGGSTPSGSSTTPSSGSSSSSSAGNGTPIKIGVITSLTGTASSGFLGTEAGVKAAFGAVNASGGVNGHKLTYEMLDDASTPTGAAAAATKGIQQDHDFGLLSVSSSFYGAYKVATAAKEPVVGSGFDGGPEWLDIKDNPTMFDVEGGVDYSTAPSTWGAAMKIMGVTKATALGYIESPSASQAAEGGVASAKAAGIATVPATEVHFGTTDVGPQVLALKSAGIDGIYTPTVPNTAFALIGGLAQAGVKLKGAILATGYGGDLLASKQAVAAGQGDYMATADAPVELKTPGTKAFQAALASYASYTGIPTFSQYQGYMTATAFAYGLGLAGANPTQASFVTALRGATWDSNGLQKPVDFATPGGIGAGMGPGNCIYLPQLKGTKFVINPKLNPICGTVIPGVKNKP
jgi:branched-chain amino acid transport system substrate-binding protein